MDAINANLKKQHVLVQICANTNDNMVAKMQDLRDTMTAGDTHDGHVYKPHVIRAIQRSDAASAKSKKKSEMLDTVFAEFDAMAAHLAAHPTATPADLRLVGRDVAKQ